jgi:hypothetical protein
MPDAVFNSLLIHLVDILRTEKAIDPIDLHPSIAQPVLFSGVAARIKAFSADNTATEGGLVIDATHKGYFKPEQDVQAGDVLHLAAGGALTGHYFVQGVEPYPDESGVHHLTTYLKKLQVKKTS